MNYGSMTTMQFLDYSYVYEELAPLPSNYTLCSGILPNPSVEWKVFNNFVLSTYQNVTNANFQYHEAERRTSPAEADTLTIRERAIIRSNRTSHRPPIWRRRGANPIPPLKLDILIRGDISWREKAFNDEMLEIVQDAEWREIQPDYFEVHSHNDVKEGVVINPPTYVGYYNVPSLGHKCVPALLPHSTNILIGNALTNGYPMWALVKSMAVAIRAYALTLRKSAKSHEVLILARQHSWQGAAAIMAATQLLKDGIPVTVFIIEPLHVANWFGSIEEMNFVLAGGAVYRNIQGLSGRKFRVVVAAFEDQYSGLKSGLPFFGELLQHAVTILVDPPILKCSYTTALQIATHGCYNMCQKTILLVPFMPKAYMHDNFVDIVVVDGGINAVTQLVSGLTNRIFPISNGLSRVNVVPVKYTQKGSRIHFYESGIRVPH